MNKKLTTYDRATPEDRQRIRRLALRVLCPDCGARPLEVCRGIGGHPAKPHWIRRHWVEVSSP